MPPHAFFRSNKGEVRRRYSSTLLPTWTWSSTAVLEAEKTSQLVYRCAYLPTIDEHANGSNTRLKPTNFGRVQHRQRGSVVNVACCLFVGCLVTVGLVVATCWISRAALFLASERSSAAQPVITPDAIVTLATNGFRSTLLSSSLRNVGGWKGPIYVFSDDAEVENSNVVTPIDIRQHHPEFLPPREFHEYKEHHNENQTYPWIKWHKTQLFDLLPDDASLVLFLDADIVVQTSLDDFWRDQQVNLQHSNHCDLSVYPERWYTNTVLSKHTNSGLWNSGVMLAKRSAQPLLHEWGRHIVTPPFSKRDQLKLTQSIIDISESSYDLSVCALRHRGRHVMNQPDLVDRIRQLLGTTTTFRHFASRKKVRKLWKETYQDD